MRNQSAENVLIEARVGSLMSDLDVSDLEHVEPHSMEWRELNRNEAAVKRCLGTLSKAEKRASHSGRYELNNAIDGLADLLEAFSEEKDYRSDIENRAARSTKDMESFVSPITPEMRDRMPKGENVRSPGADSGDTDDHQRVFAAYLRSPEGERAKADLLRIEARTASGLSGAAGGFVVPEIIDNKIQSRARDSNPFRNIVRTVNVKSGDVRFPLSEGDADQGWVGETGTRTGTTEPTLASKAPSFGVNYAYVQLSEELAMDSLIDIEEWFVEEVSRALGEAEADAIVSGNGTNKPTGILNVAPESGDDGTRTADAFKYLPSATAATLGADAAAVQDLLADMVYDLKAGYRAKGRWMMNSSTAGTLRKLKDADDRMLWSDGLSTGEPARLLGYPVTVCESMPDIGADAHPVGFGDWSRGYVLCLHGGIYVQNMDRNITTPGLHKLYVRQRIGGCAYDENAVRFAKCAAT